MEWVDAGAIESARRVVKEISPEKNPLDRARIPAVLGDNQKRSGINRFDKNERKKIK